MLVLLGETRLDYSGCLDHLSTLFAGFAADTTCPPAAFVLCGNFINPQAGLISGPGRRICLLRRLLGQLLQLFLHHFPHLNTGRPGTTSSASRVNQRPQLVLVPGPNDALPAPNIIYPQPGLSASLFLPPDLLQPAQENGFEPRPPTWLHLVSNPCRLSLYTREIVIFRSDYSRQLIRHCLHLPSAASVLSDPETYAFNQPDLDQSGEKEDLNEKSPILAPSQPDSVSLHPLPKTLTTKLCV
ncbi:unnamed protein product [Protopolystoma xenopodis]|uniref:DNA polymerase II subunit 2 n=1 Tax=Protopolystoma xenopodis TaxID=117903 RepID=A0A448WTK9_9PLAT|nr:unnamed protein product [Protopolystoma xenopodis]